MNRAGHQRKNIMAISLNQVCLIGKVGFEPRLRSLPSGVKVADIGLGVSESFKKDGEWASKTHFVDLVLWEQQAEQAASRIKKGDTISVLGSLQYESWEKDGKKNSRLRVKVQRIQKIPLMPKEETVPA